ncbi:MAG: hypothetical protein ACLFUR_06465 [Candidatus Hadarchaeia archaeon]
MVVTNTEHPPAAGTALALAEGNLLKGAIFVLTASLIFSAIRRLLSSKLKNLAD